MLEPAITASKGELQCDGVPLSSIAKSVPPPFYVYSARAIVERYRAADRAFGGEPHLICFAIKANSHPALLRLLAAEGAGAEVVSGAEMLLALAVGFGGDRIIFSGVGKSPDELELAIEKNLLVINAESIEEVEMLESLASRAGTALSPDGVGVGPHARNPKTRVGIRLNQGIDPHTHPHMATGVKDAKFGVAVETAREIFGRRERYPHLDFIGLHSHIGSQIVSVAPLAENARKLADLVAELRRSGVHITEVDVGGGLGISYRDESPPDFDGYACALEDALRETGARILMELGRSLLGPAGALVVSVLYVKEVHGRRYVVVNSGMNDLLRPALYGAYHRIAAVLPRSGAERPTDVVGAVCESSDAFGKDRLLPELKPGDLLAVLDAGAYGYSMSSNYNLRPRPAEVLVEGDRFRLIRAPETMEGLVAHELASGLQVYPNPI